MSVFDNLFENELYREKQEQQFNLLDTNFLIRQQFKNSAIATFTYKNIPEFIRLVPEFIEECLYNFGSVAYFRVDDNLKNKLENGTYDIILPLNKTDKDLPFSLKYGDYVAPCFASGILLPNGLYTHYNIIFPNGLTCRLPIEDIEICFNNSLHTPTKSITEAFVEKCTKTLSCVDTALDRATIANILLSDEERVTNLLIESVSNRKNLINIASTDYKATDVQTLKLYDDRETTILNIWDIFTRYKNMYFNYIGINNVDISKKERLTLSESNANTEETRYSIFNDFYEHRREWLDRIKEHFNVDIELIINRDYDTVNALTSTLEEKREQAQVQFNIQHNVPKDNENSDESEVIEEDESKV